MEGPTEIVPAVYGLGSELVNWYLVEQDGRLTAVDSGLAGFAGTLEQDLARIGHGLADIEAVVLTHSDADHTGLAPRLREAGARILIHERDEATLRRPGPKRGDASPIHLLPWLLRPGPWKLFGHMLRRGGGIPARIEGAETFSTGQELDVPGRPRVLHTPGHTDGHCALDFASHGALFVGDAMCTWNPLTGATGPQLMPRPLNVSNAECLSSLDAIESVGADVLLPGHGEPWRGGVATAVTQARGLALS
jgi:glyoxylase-like metal-dependent hydrolase (beta-lactamase superfamily II)